jgi:hypothetical protein
MPASKTKQRPKMTFTPPSEPPQPLGKSEALPPPPPGEGIAGTAATPTTATNSRQRSRVGKRAVTFYVSQDAFRQLGVLSAQTDKTIQTLMQEAVDWVFQEHGLHRIAKD